MDYKDKNVQVLVIDVKEPKELIAQKLRDRYNLSFPILADEDGAVATRFAPLDALPELSRDEVMLASNLIIDPQGKILSFVVLDKKVKLQYVSVEPIKAFLETKGKSLVYGDDPRNPGKSIIFSATPVHEKEKHLGLFTWC